MRKFLLSILSLTILGCSLTTEEAFEKENFKPAITYSPLSLKYKDKPIFSIGTPLDSLSKSMEYKINKSDKYHHSPESITDYICHDQNLTIWLDTGYVSGSIQFSSDNKSNKIFRLLGFWNFDTPNNEVSASTINQFTSKFFPILNGKLEINNGWSYSVNHQHFQELFNLNLKNNLWVLKYEVELK